MQRLVPHTVSSMIMYLIAMSSVVLCMSDMSGIQYRVLNKKKGPAVWVRVMNIDHNELE